MKRIKQIFERLTGSALRAAPLAIFLGGAFASSQMAFAQVEWPPAQLKESHTVIPRKGAANEDAQVQSMAGATIPMSTFTHTASKDKGTYTSTIVGTSPFATSLTGTTINALVVPLIFTGYDPTIGDPCDSDVSALTRFQNSPLTQNVPLTIEGVNVGNTQFINGFRRAEFWQTIGGSSAYQNTINFSYYTSGVPISGAPISTVTVSSDRPSCPHYLGVLPAGSLQPFLEDNLIPSLQSQGVIAPNQFVIFLLHNVVQQVAGGYALGFHGAVGNPVQTYAVVDWDTTSAIPGVADGSVASEVIAGWMDDPLGTNLTPAWGNVGQVSGCEDNWESGYPLMGTLMPPITSGNPSYSYHMQELAYFSFYFNLYNDPSVGASYYIYVDGTFSSNGSFLAPAAVCPTGGLAPFQGKWTYPPISQPVSVTVVPRK